MEYPHETYQIGRALGLLESLFMLVLADVFDMCIFK